MKKPYFKPLLACVWLIAALFSSSAVMADTIIITNPVTGHKYQRIDKPATWTQARDYCKNIVSPAGGYLVTITNQAEQDFIMNNFVYGNYWWIGASDADQQCVWKWAATTEKFTYSHWGAGEPKLANGQYVYMNWDGTWGVTTDTNGIVEFICEWGGAAYKDYVGSAFLNDMNANGFAEIATLYTDDATGKVTVKIEDTNTKAVISTIVFGRPNKSFPQAIAVQSSAAGQQIAVLLIDNITLKATQEIRDAATGALIASVPF